VKFKYHKINLTPSSDFFGKSILKPVIPIKISRSGLTLQYSALIDSGADFSIFDAGIGEYLGINIKSGTEIRFSGVQNVVGAKAYIHRVNVEVGGYQFKADVGFSYDISQDGYGILGQKGFF
jgi:hypothetical protein